MYGIISDLDKKAIRVEGVGRISVKPDRIIINIDHKVTEPIYEDSLGRATKELDILRSALVSAGHKLDSLITESFSVDTVYKRYKKGDESYERFAGYACYHRLRLEFDYDKKILSKTINAITNCNVHPRFDIEFSIKDKSLIARQLLERAIADSFEKAELLSKAADIQLGAICAIDCSRNEIRFHSITKIHIERSSEGRMKCSTGCNLEIEPNVVSVSSEVSVVWEIQ